MKLIPIIGDGIRLSGLKAWTDAIGKPLKTTQRIYVESEAKNPKTRFVRHRRKNWILKDVIINTFNSSYCMAAILEDPKTGNLFRCGVDALLEADVRVIIRKCK